MKFYFSVLLIALALFSCKKQDQKLAPPPVRNDHGYITNVEAYLKNQLSAVDYASIDTSQFYVSKEGRNWLLRIGIAGKNIDRDFMLLQTDSTGMVFKSQFVYIRRDSSGLQTFNGRISTESLQHSAPFKRIFSNNVITGTSTAKATIENSEEADQDDDIVPADDCTGCLPLVVVVGYTGGGGESSGGGISYADYLNLMELANGSSSTIGASSGIYSPIATAGSISAGGVTSGGSSIKPLPGIAINFETSYSKPGIDVNAFMKCFASIPDAGSTCSITVYTDLPVNDNPQYIFNILTGATGHAFLSLTKTNGAQSVTQYIGKTTSKAIAVLGFPVTGKIVDNTAHKYNATLTMNVTPSQLQTAINQVVSIGSTPSYDMWENNCVDYALSILNSVRPNNPLYVGMSIDPSTGDEYQTPQGLYIALQNLKNQNGADAPNITMDVIKNAGISKGACN